MELTTLAQAVVNGVMMGGIYSLVAVGLTIIFGVVRIVNFAQGEFVMMGMYITYLLWSMAGIDPIVSILASFPVMFLFGALVQRCLFRPILGAPDLAQIFLTVGLSLVLQNLALLAFTASYYSVRVPYGGDVLRFAGVTVSIPRLLAFAAALALGSALGFYLFKTDTGKAMRAAAQDREMATLLGIDPERIYMLAVGLGAGLAGAAGSAIMPYFYVFPTVGNSFVLVAFVVVILGGMGNVRGAFLGGLIIGVAESLGVQYLGSDAGPMVAFAVLVLVLVVRPTGLLAPGRA